MAALVCSLLCGCAAITNPVANGIPARLLPPELRAERKANKVSVPLSHLRRQPPPSYKLRPGDVLAVYVEGIWGEPGQVPPVNFPSLPDLPPSVGFPVPIRENGTLPLPEIDPPKIEGMTVEEAERAILNAYVAKEILKPDSRRVFITLIRPRPIRVLVIRQDSVAGGAQNVTIRTGGIGGFDRATIPGALGGGSGEIVELSPFENDVLSALTQTGGLPGPDASSEIVVFRGNESDRVFGPGMFDRLNASTPFDPHVLAGEMTATRIPLRLDPGAPVRFAPEEAVLHSGDIVFVAGRSSEVFYTGGLLPPGAYPLPRDEDLDVIQAISLIGGPLVNGGTSGNNLTGAIGGAGLGNPSPSLLTVLRKTPDGQQVPIRVDLREALRDPNESLLVQAGDMLILQETPGQAFARYLSGIVDLSIIGEIFSRQDASGGGAVSLP